MNRDSYAYAQGYRWGAIMRVNGNNYAKVNGVYPSNPYNQSEPECEEYNLGYEAGFHRKEQS